MSVDIFVQRGSGNKPGDDIVDTLVSEVAVAVQRGRNELDERAQRMQVVALDVLYRTGVRLGKLAQCNDAVRGVWTGKVAGISHRVRGVELTTTLQLKRPVAQ